MTSPSITPEATSDFGQHVQRISHHSSVFLLGTLFSAVAGYFFKVYLARVLGAEALGIYALGMTVVGLFGIFGGLGLTWAAARFPAAYTSTGRMEDLRAFKTWSVLILVAVNGSLAALIVLGRRWLSLHVYHTPALIQYLHFFALIMFLGTLTTFFGQLLTGYMAVAKRTVIANFGGNLLAMVLTVVLLQMGKGLGGYIFAQVVSAIVILGLLVWTAHRLTPVAARFRLQAIHRPHAEMFSFAAAAFAMDIMGFVYTQTDKVVLGFFLDARSVGIYAVSATIVAFVSVVLQSVSQIFSPTIADLHARGEMDMLNRLFQSLTKWVTALTLPLAVVVIVFSPAMMRIFGREFEVGWIVLVVGTCGQMVNCATGSVGYLLLMSGNEKRLVRIQMLVAPLTVAVCLLMVPHWGLAGAAIAAALGNALSNLWCLLEVRWRLGLYPYNQTYWKLALPCAATVALALGMRMILRSRNADIPGLILVILAVYAVFLGTLRASGIEGDDRLVLNAIWGRVRSLWVLPPLLRRD